MYTLCTLYAVELVFIDENVYIFTPFMLIQIQRYFMYDGQSQVKINFKKKKRNCKHSNNKTEERKKIYEHLMVKAIQSAASDRIGIRNFVKYEFKMRT